MAKNKITVLLEGHEEIASEGIQLLEEKNYELFFPKSIDELLSNEEIRSSNALLVRGAIIERELIESMPNLKVIARSGVGTDNIDLEAATDANVFVCNVPDANFTSVAEHVIGMLVSLSHQIVNGDRAIRKGQFDARHQYMGSELTGKTIGVIGFGRIGQLVAKKCVQGLDMSVLAYDPYVKETDLEAVELVDSTDDIFENADFITLHLPYIPSLHHFINADVFKKMKKTAYIINCARGGLIDEVALADAIKHGEIAGAGIDVFQNEPPEKDHVLWDVENVIATPHMGASTNESLTRMAVGAVKEIIRVLDGEQPVNALNNIKLKM
ncbi:MAG TPA: hydroxyacid dehydrogenase [Pseudogracilibacillus sp.]|nr:hydroxyacid dehydrogenase [Pseudogracilibacillus sp.]